MKKDKFIKKAHPSEWFQVADELNHSAEVLFRDIGQNRIGFIDLEGEANNKPAVSRSYFLIAGMTIENLLKSLIIANDPKLVADGTLNKKISKGHRLSTLAERVDLYFSPNEVKFLEVLSEAIPYWSRYPIPRNWNQLKKEKVLTSEIHKTYKLLYQKLRREIYEATKFGWKGPDGTQVGEWFCSEYEPDFPAEKYINVPFEEIMKERRELISKRTSK